jgi:hypothetical protein
MTPENRGPSREGPLFVFDSKYFAQVVSRGKKIGSRMDRCRIFRHGKDRPSRFSQVSWYNDFLKTFSAIFKLERKPKIHLEIRRGC